MVVFVAQLAICGLLWAFIVWRLAFNRERLLRRSAAQSASTRTRAALAMLFASLAVLLLGMVALANGGLRREGGLSWWGWPLVALVGALFIALQTFALVPLVLNAARAPVTGERGGTSDTIDGNRP